MAKAQEVAVAKSGGVARGQMERPTGPPQKINKKSNATRKQHWDSVELIAKQGAGAKINKVFLNKAHICLIL